MTTTPRYLRVLVSYVAAAGSAWLVAFLGHVHVAWRNPATWPHVLDHRCGRVMLLCVAWAMLELTAALVLPGEGEPVAPRGVAAASC